MKFKNAKGVQQGIEMAIFNFLDRAQMASDQARHHRALHYKGVEWARDLWLRFRDERHNWIHAARVLREYTHRGVPVHIAGARKYRRAMEHCARLSEAA